MQPVPAPLPTPEPIRLPAWAFNLALIFGPTAISLLTGIEWKAVLAASLTGALGNIVLAERARSQVVPNVKVVEAVDTAKAISYAAGRQDEARVAPDPVDVDEVKAAAVAEFKAGEAKKRSAATRRRKAAAATKSR